MIGYSNLLHPYKHQNRSVKRLPRIECGEVVRAFLAEYKTTFPGYEPITGMRVRTSDDASWLLEQLNNPGMRGYNVLQQLVGMGETWQTFDFVRSNLGKGFIFYFVCKGCEQRTKFIYMPEGQQDFMCRLCYGLVYI